MLNALPVLVVSSTPEQRENLARTIAGCGFRTVCCATLSEALSLLRRQHFAMAFCEDELPDGNFRSLIRAAGPTGVPVVVVSRHDEWETFLGAMKAGAFDYVAMPPLLPGEVGRLLWSALSETSRLEHLEQTAA
jgi:DNA-binding NtrC family response regulator